MSSKKIEPKKIEPKTETSEKETLVEEKAEMAKFLETLAQAFEENDEQRFSDPLSKLLAANPQVTLTNPEYVYDLIQAEIEPMSDLLIRRCVQATSVVPENEQLMYFLFSHYGLLEKHAELLMRSFEGFACITDKTRWLLAQYLKTLRNETDTQLDSAEKKPFWMPLVSDITLWSSFFNAIFELFFLGKTEKYLKYKTELEQKYIDAVAEKKCVFEKKCTQHPFFARQEDAYQGSDQESSTYFLIDPQTQDCLRLSLDGAQLRFRFTLHQEPQIRIRYDDLPEWAKLFLQT